MRALVTGASSGLGRDIARVLSKKRISLVLVARRRERLEELRRELSVPVEIIPCDLSSLAACRALYGELRDEHMDIVVNNAGFGVYGSFDQTNLEQELRLIDTNIRAVHVLTKLFLADFIRRDSGYLLNVASAAGYLPGPQMAAYYASKSYVLCLTQAIREELAHAHSRVGVTALCPGPVSTEFNRVAKVSFRLPQMSSEEVARLGIEAMFRKKAVVIPGAYMKALRVVEHLIPDRLLTAAAYYMQKPGRK